MKNQIRQFSKFLLVCLLLAFISCERDIYEDQLTSRNTEKKFITLAEFKTDSKAFTLYDNIVKANEANIKAQNGLTQARLIYNDALGFFINTDKILYTVKDDLRCYTFEIYRNKEDMDKVENLVLTFKSNHEFETYLTEYKFTDDEKTMIQQGLTVPLNQSKVSLKSYNGTNLFETYDYSGQIYHGSDGNCYVIDHIVNLGGGVVDVYYILVDCPASIVMEPGGAGGGSYTTVVGVPIIIGGNYGINLGSGQWIGGGNSNGGGNPSGTISNPNNSNAGIPFINTSPVLADNTGSGLAYQIAKGISSHIELTNDQFHYLMLNPEIADDFLYLLTNTDEVSNEDQIAWSNLINNCSEGDYSFEVNNTVTEDNALVFENMSQCQEFLYSFNNQESESSELINIDQDTKVASFTKTFNLFTNIDAEVNQTLNPHRVNSVSTSLSGNTIGLSYEQTTPDVGSEVITQNPNVKKVIVKGNLSFNIFVEGIGTIHTFKITIILYVNSNTGEPITIVVNGMP
jgi:hypothetical protein